MGTRGHALLLPALAVALVLPCRVAAAQDADGYPSWAAVPQLSLGRLGYRWERRGAAPLRMGPGTAPMLGVALQHRAPGSRLTVEVLGGFALSDYAFKLESGSNDVAPERWRSGRIHLVRAHAGIHYRARPAAPGYFAAGAGALYYRPVERPASPENEPVLTDDAQWMPSFHAGGGIDLASGPQRIRLDARIYGSRPTQKVVTGELGELHALGLPLDFLVSIGYLLRL